MPSSRRRSTPTSSEVALRAGVSRTTVSFVLNDVRSRGISEETRQKVLDAARDLRYEPHAAARVLAGGRTGTIAVVIPASDHLHVDAYLPRVLATVNDCCHALGYKVLLEIADDQGKSKNAFVNLVRSKRIDGLVVVNPRDDDLPGIRRLVEQGFPVVVPSNGTESFYTRRTLVDDIACARLVTEHLVGLGHRRIAHIGFASTDYVAVRLRQEGYMQILREHGIEFDPALVEYAAISAQSGYTAMQRLLARKVEFTALFAGNDTIAFGAMRALYEAQLRIPEDVAVVGYDDIPLAAFAVPPLTTLRIDPVSQGREAVDMLIARMAGEAYEAPESAYAFELIVRQSCGTPKKRRNARKP